LQPTTWYTCPVGKRAKCKGIVACENFGAAANAFIEVSGDRIAQWNFTGCQPSGVNVFDLCRDIPFHFDVTLEAGDTLITDQNTGTNAEFLMVAEVEELPA